MHIAVGMKTTKNKLDGVEQYLKRENDWHTFIMLD